MKSFNLRVLPCLAALLALVFAGAVHASRCYVKPDAPSSNSGLSWSTASTLQSALSNAVCTEIWVAGGVYKPSVKYGEDVPDPRAVTFNILPGTAVFGGFAGIETLLAQRDPAAYPSILSGDIDGDDTDTDGNHIAESSADIQGANAFHVLTMDGTTGTPILDDTVLDGFVITAGSADYPGGGGLLCLAWSDHTARCQPTLNHLLFSGNLATDYGGAISNWAIYGGKASPTILNSTFVGNRSHETGSQSKGGAIHNEGYGGAASPMLVNVSFVGNSADNGGAMYNSGYSGVSNPTLINVTFTDNTASDCGGAVFTDVRSGGVSVPAFANVIIWGNHAGTPGGEQLCSDAGSTNPGVARPMFEYSIVQGYGGSANWNDALGEDLGGNLDADPKLGTLAWQGGFVPTIAFGSGSAALDAGADSMCPLTDARGVSRDAGTHCDIGAFESTDFIFANGFE